MAITAPALLPLCLFLLPVLRVLPSLLFLLLTLFLNVTLTPVCPSHPQAVLSSLSRCVALLKSDRAEGGTYGDENSSASADAAPLLSGRWPLLQALGFKGAAVLP